MRVTISAVGATPPQAELDALIALFNAGQPGDVIVRGEALAGRYRSAFVFNVLGVAHTTLKQLDKAVTCFRNGLAIAPDDAAIHNNLGYTLQELGRLEEAMAHYERALQIAPAYAEAHNNLGNALKDMGRLGAAIACYERALAIAPDYTFAHNNMGVAFQKSGRLDRAVACYLKALAINPDYAEAHSNLGGAYNDLGQANEALAHNQRALAINPNDAAAHNNLGVLLRGIGRREGALASLQRAIAIKPAYADAHSNLANVLAELGRREEAIASYERALAIRPDFAEARVHKLHQQAHVCDWDGIAREAKLIPPLGVEGEVVFPSLMLSLEDRPDRHLVMARRLAAARYRPSEVATFTPPAIRPRRLRIGYFSADFHEHATMHLMIRMLELHDRQNFEVFAYSFGPHSTDPMRQRVVAAVDVFHDVRGIGDKDVAALARRDGIDIAIDLKGYTQDTRLGIFAWRCAPIQIAFLGYPGTTGAPFIDYLVADRHVIPESLQHHYSEKIITLPNSYQVNDSARTIADRVPTRAEMGLPNTAFVFCSFNNTYKITPEEFDIWMRLLQQIEGSVLWLKKANPWAVANLGREAQKRGIDPSRLIWADHMPQAEHLARQKLADLFLDTFNVNAHTTASDALWAGLPVVTKMGKGFAARVAGSLLHAVGLPDLATDTAKDYERLALGIAKSPKKLAKIRKILAANRQRMPLFDTALFCRHIEQAYEDAYAIWRIGEEPRHIIVEADGAESRLV
jgi:predicted O-linked N-acetylglucosamine transferase (SPINDLY family)